MIAGVTIDGVDIYSTYGAYLSRGSLASVVGWAGAKSVTTNNWQEYDGLEPDLSELHLSNRSITLKFGFGRGIDKIIAFMDFLYAMSIREYSFEDIGMTLKMRLVSSTSMDYAIAVSTLSATFSCDTPMLDGYTYTEPQSDLPESDEYTIDGKRLSDYGIIVLQDTLSSVTAFPKVKELLKRDLERQDGVTYDENPIDKYADGVWSQSSSVVSTPTRSSADVTLKCYQKAPDCATLWANNYAFLHDIIKQDDTQTDVTLKCARTLAVKATGKTYQCFYKSQSVSDILLFEDCVWLLFSLTLTRFGEE